MPSEREIRRRIRSVRNIQQVTKAMQTVAASRMRRAQQAVLASRPYEERLRGILNDLAPHADPEAHALLARREVKRAAIILISTDRGLVGGLNTNVVRTALRFAETLPGASYVAVGRKATNRLGALLEREQVEVQSRERGAVEPAAGGGVVRHGHLPAWSFARSRCVMTAIAPSSGMGRTLARRTRAISAALNPLP